MPQLSPLPWLTFLFISIFPMIFVVINGEVIFTSIKIMTESEVFMVILKW